MRYVHVLSSCSLIAVFRRAVSLITVYLNTERSRAPMETAAEWLTRDDFQFELPMQVSSIQRSVTASVSYPAHPPQSTICKSVEPKVLQFKRPPETSVMAMDTTSDTHLTAVKRPRSAELAESSAKRPSKAATSSASFSMLEDFKTNPTNGSQLARSVQRDRHWTLQLTILKTEILTKVPVHHCSAQARCVLCKLAQRAGSHYLNAKSLDSSKCAASGLCFSCFGTHTKAKCEVAVVPLLNVCFICGLHGGPFHVTRHGVPANFGKTCDSWARGLVLPICWFMWHCPKDMADATCPVPRDEQSPKAIYSWLFRSDCGAVPNLVRLAWWAVTSRLRWVATNSNEP